MTTRRLSAVMVADVVGFSAQMERDDAGTLARLRTVRDEIVDPAIAANGGRIVKTTGDGLLGEFGSADASLRCAVAIQRALAGRNALLDAHDRLELRIGINLGDVIAEGDDIFGDGVNVAARLEAFAPPGGICVSQAVRDHVHGTLDVEFEDAGEQHARNISRPIRTFNIAFAQRAAVRPSDDRTRTMSIGVMPFTAADDAPVTARDARSLTRDFAGMLARCGTLATVISMDVNARASSRYVAQAETAALKGEKVMGASLGDDLEGNLWLAAAHAQVGDARRAAALREAVLSQLPGFTIALHRARSRSLEPAYLSLADMHFYAGLRKAGFREA